MALIDLTSDLTWTGQFGPGVYENAVQSTAPPPLGGVPGNLPAGAVPAGIEVTSNFEEEYNKFKMRDEAYNATGYFRQPFILRGIQRPNKKRQKPERWGVGNAIGDPFIRGGVTTVLDRVLSDEIRIGKFLAKPQGLLFMAKQLGLQLSNPNVETKGGRASKPFAQATKWFTPINLLANIAGNPFGLHFKRHGLFPIGGVMSYTDNVDKERTDKTKMNRLVNLKSELLDGQKTEGGLAATGLGQKIKAIQKKLGFEGQEIKTLSGITGPGSIYGLGATTMRRVSTTIPTDDREILGLGQWGVYTQLKQYSGGEDGFWYLKKKDGSVFTMNTVDGQKDWYEHLGVSRGTQLDANYNPNDDHGAGNFPKDALAENATIAGTTTIQKYSVSAYGNIPKNPGKIQPNDFRANGAFINAIDTPFIGDPALMPYAQKNLDSRLGIGDPGREGLNRTNPETAAPDSTGDKPGVDKVNNLQFGANYTNDAKDLVKFIMRVGVGGKPIIFRAFITSINDSFNPSYKDVLLYGYAQGLKDYDQYSRDISISFVVAAQSRDEMKNIWIKLDKLAQLTLPNTGGAQQDTTKFATVTFLTVGNMYRGLNGHITSLSYDWDSESPWDIIYELPMATTVDMTFTVLRDPAKMGSDFTKNKIFNGLPHVTFK